MSSRRKFLASASALTLGAITVTGKENGKEALVHHVFFLVEESRLQRRFKQID